MKIDDYQEFVAITDSTRERNYDVRLKHYVAGLNTEANEVLGVLQRAVRYDIQLNREHLISELGDVLWYVAAFADLNNMTLEDVMAYNMNKLTERKQKGKA